MVDNKERITERVEETSSRSHEHPRIVAPEKADSGGRGTTGAVLLIGLGAFLLLKNLGLWTFNFWALLQYWPVFLIVAGLDLMMRGKSQGSKFVRVILGLLIVGGVMFLARNDTNAAAPSFFGNATVATGPTVTEDFSFPVSASTDSLEVDINLEFSRVTLGDGDSNDIVGSATTNVRLAPETSYDERGGVGHLEVTAPNQNINFGGNIEQHYVLDLPRDIPIDLNLSTNFGEMALDLSGLNIASLTVATDAGEIGIEMPENSEISEVEINTDFGEIVVSFANGAEYSIDTMILETDAGSINLELAGEGVIDSLALNADFGEITMDIKGDPLDIELGELNVSADAGSIDLVLPGGDYQAYVSSDFGGVDIRIPDGIAAQLYLETEFGDIDLNGRFDNSSNGSGSSDSSIGDERATWEDNSFGRADDRVDLTVETSAGGIDIR